MVRASNSKKSRKSAGDRLRKPHVKKGDTVIVISGVEKGSTGKVLTVDRARWRVIVEGVNRRQQTIRATPSHPQGGMIEKECPLHISNVMLLEEYEERRKRREARAGIAPAPETTDETPKAESVSGNDAENTAVTEDDSATGQDGDGSSADTDTDESNKGDD